MSAEQLVCLTVQYGKDVVYSSFLARVRCTVHTMPRNPFNELRADVYSQVTEKLNPIGVDVRLGKWEEFLKALDPSEALEVIDHCSKKGNDYIGAHSKV